MDKTTPDEEFEMKMITAAAAPLPDAAFVDRLRYQIISGRKPVKFTLWAWLLDLLPGERKHTISNSTCGGKNSFISRPARFMVPVLSILVLAAAGIFFFTRSAAPVSAQEIIDRSTAVLTASKPSNGIWHQRLETIDNPLAISGDLTVTKKVRDELIDLATGKVRIITTDAAGRVVKVFGNDGAYYYRSQPIEDEKIHYPLVVIRAPTHGEDKTGNRAIDPTQVSRGIFDQFNNNPRVTISEKTTWVDGTPVYILVLPNTRSEKQADGSESHVITGKTIAVFNAVTYRILEYKTVVYQDGNEIIITSVSFPVDEILPAETRVAWDLSDLKDITIVDEKPDRGDEAPVEFKIVSEQGLAAVANGYVLKPVPSGFTQKIVLIPGKKPGDPPQNYEINYSSEEKDTFGMQWVGTLEPGFVEANFYDGSYKSASGLEVHYSPSSHDNKSGGTNAMLVTPGGDGFLLISSLPREKVQALVDTLAPIKK